MDDKQKNSLKISLKEKAVEILHQRIEHAAAAVHEAQMAANEGEKSSVGDKYETTRAMAQIDRDIHARQLESAQKELTFIQHVDVSVFCTKVEVGAYVVAGNDKYFFLTGLGPVELNGDKIFFLSISSPIGQAFNGKKAGSVVSFNGKQIPVVEVF